MKILLADDSQPMRSMLRRIIHQSPLPAISSATILEAADGIEALHHLQADTGSPIDLAIIDWIMPNMNGYALVKSIRQNDKNLPIIMVSAESDKHRVMDAIKAGVTYYIIKPFSPDALHEKIERLKGTFPIIAPTSHRLPQNDKPRCDL